MPVALLNHVSCRFQGPHERVFRVGTSAKLQTARQSPRAAARKAGESRRRVPARAVHRSELASYLLGSQEQRGPLRPARRREANRLLRGSSKFGCFFSNASSLVRCAGRRERANSVGRNVRGWTRHFGRLKTFGQRPCGHVYAAFPQAAFRPFPRAKLLRISRSWLCVVPSA